MRIFPSFKKKKTKNKFIPGISVWNLENSVESMTLSDWRRVMPPVIIEIHAEVSNLPEHVTLRRPVVILKNVFAKTLSGKETVSLSM